MTEKCKTNNYIWVLIILILFVYKIINLVLFFIKLGIGAHC